MVNSSGTALIGASVWVSSNTTVTDFSGDYRLNNIPPGNTTVYANTSGYSTNSVSVTVAIGTVAYASNIVLTSTSSIYGTITGKVTKASDLSAISGAKVSASGKETYTDSAGNYVLSDINPGTIGVSVNAYGFSSKTDNVSVTAGATSSKDFSMDAVSVSSFSDDFETDKGWLYESLWHRVQNSSSSPDLLAPTYVTLPDYSTTNGSIPTAHGGLYSAWYGSDTRGCYIGVQETDPVDTPLSGGTSTFRMQGNMTSPSINLNGYADATLSFWAWWEVEGVNPATGFDIMKVRISKDGGATWGDLLTLNPVLDPDPASKIPYFPYSSGGYNLAGAWIKHQLPLSSYAGSTVRIRFSFDTYDRKYNGFRGWFLDDVSISPDKISVSTLIRPSTRPAPSGARSRPLL
ncbi:MAG: carboxypeptidase regulatory-like domain-containing protein, partial [Candidatus Margulisiibacteriota bacterium]